MKSSVETRWTLKLTDAHPLSQTIYYTLHMIQRNQICLTLMEVCPDISAACSDYNPLLCSVNIYKDHTKRYLVEVIVN